MKQKLTLFIICVLVLSLFAGCAAGYNDPKISGEIVFIDKSQASGVYMIINVSGTEMSFFVDKDTEVIWDDDDEIYKHYDLGRHNLSRESVYDPSPKGEFLDTKCYVDISYDISAIYTVPETEKDVELKFYDSSRSRYDIKRIAEIEWREAKSITVTGMDIGPVGPLAYKPVIYLYPETETDVSVKLDYDGVLTSTYPAYNSGWNVTASPDGTIINQIDGREYSYLFWEGQSNVRYDMSKGFVVKGEDTADFLQNTLEAIGLTPKEYNEMIVFWLPQMEHNPYNLITFQKEAYTDGAVLEIDPSPDSVLRVFMAWQSLDEPIDIEPPEIEPFERVGFTVVEWGGTEIK